MIYNKIRTNRMSHDRKLSNIMVFLKSLGNEMKAKNTTLSNQFINQKSKS